MSTPSNAPYKVLQDRAKHCLRYAKVLYRAQEKPAFRVRSGGYVPYPSISEIQKARAVEKLNKEDKHE